MVFTRENLNGTGEIVVYSNYHKYWLDKERRIKNPLFDVFSGRILDLKDGKESAIQYFYDILDKEICRDVAICVVPSSTVYKTDSGIAKLGIKLAENGRKDRVYFLTRERSIAKLAAGGDRSKQIHMETIGTLSDMSIEDEIVLLMDDVTTTGNSLYACKDILVNSGAKEVEMFALGKAI